MIKKGLLRTCTAILMSVAMLSSCAEAEVSEKNEVIAHSASTTTAAELTTVTTVDTATTTSETVVETVATTSKVEVTTTTSEEIIYETTYLVPIITGTPNVQEVTTIESAVEKDSQSETVILMKSNVIKAHTTDYVNFRNKPSMESGIIDKLQPGTEIYVEGLTKENGFYTCSVNGVKGYIFADYVKVNSKQLYATDDTLLTIGGDEKILKAGSSITLYEAYDGKFVESKQYKYVEGIEKLITYSEYKENMLKYAELEEVASFSTNYSHEEKYAGKAFNIQHCCEELSGIVIPSGENFNWHIHIGNTNKADGYRLANVYSGGQTIQGYGGGVCQVSTTMYGCVRALDLKVVERHPHGMPVDYVDWYAGEDAAVDDIGGFNFIYTNTKDYDIYIEAFTSVDESQPLKKRGVLTVKFYKVIY